MDVCEILHFKPRLSKVDSAIVVISGAEMQSLGRDGTARQRAQRLRRLYDGYPRFPTTQYLDLVSVYFS